MIIKNKIESLKKINELGLNKFPEQIFKNDEKDKIEEFIKKGGNYVCNLAGHNHHDEFGLTQKGVLNVVVENANDWDKLGDANRVLGTKSYDCFNVVAVDTDMGLLKIVRIGSNVDHYLREKNYLCFDYINKKVIVQK